MTSCKHFKCCEANNCPDCYNGKCTGSGHSAYPNCGCDMCEYQVYKGDIITCTKLEAHIRDDSDDWGDGEDTFNMSDVSLFL